MFISESKARRAIESSSEPDVCRTRYISPALALAAARIHWTIVHVILQLICALHALGLIVRSIADRII
jgi:hypothetical protein